MDASVLQALLQVQRKAQQDLGLDAVLDLLKATIELTGENVKSSRSVDGSNDTAYVESHVRPMVVLTHGDATNYKAELTNGVPESAPSSPVLFNAYIDELSRQLEKIEGRSGNVTGKWILC